MTYYLATTEKKVRWYAVKDRNEDGRWGFELLDVLDLERVSCFGDKETARSSAQAMGLSVWRYFRSP